MPKNPGPKDRKHSGYELVVKAPQRAVPEAGGGIAVSPKVFGLQAKDPDGARLEALIFLARKSGRRRRASTWPIERIQALLVCDVLKTYADVFLADPPKGAEEQESPARFKTRTTYRYSISAFRKAFPELEVGDVGEWLVVEYCRRPADRSKRSKLTDLYTVRRSLKEGLKHLGVPPTYNCHFRIPDPGMSPKVAWTPEEYDRLRAAADGYVFEADGTPKMIRGPDGPMQQRRFDRWVWPRREAWRRAIQFLPYTVSRHGRLPLTRWVPPEAEPMDGKPLPKNDRPWIEVTDDEIFYHRDGEAGYDGNKRRGGNKIPKEFAPTVRAWYEADMAAGREFVFCKLDGSRYPRNHLCKETFKNIVKDAGIAEDRVPHHLKDLDWSDEAGMDRETLAVHADTTARTLGKKYGDPTREALLDQAAAEMTQGAPETSFHKLDRHRGTSLGLCVRRCSSASAVTFSRKAFGR